jgi:hypothetical protein
LRVTDRSQFSPELFKTLVGQPKYLTNTPHSQEGDPPTGRFVFVGTQGGKRFSYVHAARVAIEAKSLGLVAFHLEFRRQFGLDESSFSFTERPCLAQHVGVAVACENVRQIEPVDGRGLFVQLHQ